MIGALRRGFCKIVTNEEDGLYTVTEEVYDATNEETEAGTANMRVVNADAYEIDGVDFLAASGEKFPFVEVIGKEGKPIILFQSRHGLFPITLTQTGGTAVDDDETQADWTYTVADAISGESLGTGVNPTSGNHMWVRPSVGYMTPATAGMAYRKPNGDMVILWINEVADGAACG